MTGKKRRGNRGKGVGERKRGRVEENKWVEEKQWAEEMKWK